MCSILWTILLFSLVLIFFFIVSLHLILYGGYLFFLFNFSIFFSQCLHKTHIFHFTKIFIHEINTKRMQREIFVSLCVHFFSFIFIQTIHREKMCFSFIFIAHISSGKMPNKSITYKLLHMQLLKKMCFMLYIWILSNCTLYYSVMRIANEWIQCDDHHNTAIATNKKRKNFQRMFGQSFFIV